MSCDIAMDAAHECVHSHDVVPVPVAVPVAVADDVMELSHLSAFSRSTYQKWLHSSPQSVYIATTLPELATLVAEDPVAFSRALRARVSKDHYYVNGVKLHTTTRSEAAALAARVQSLIREMVPEVHVSYNTYVVYVANFCKYNYGQICLHKDCCGKRAEKRKKRRVAADAAAAAQRVEDAKLPRACRVCNSRDATLASLPCGHLTLCTTCVPPDPRSSTCAVCAAPITEWIHLYF